MDTNVKYSYLQYNNSMYFHYNMTDLLSDYSLFVAIHDIYTAQRVIGHWRNKADTIF